MKKRRMFFRAGIDEAAGRKLSYIGAATAFILAATTIPLFSPASPFGWHALPDTVILVLGGWGILKGKRLVSIILPAYALASRYIVNETLGYTSPDVIASYIVFPAYALGIIGAFARNRAVRIKAAAKDTRWIDADIAASFTRVAGAAGISFGILLVMFSLAELGGFTRFNLTDAFLIILFAWYTLKRRLWAAAAQLIVSFGNMAISYSQTGSFSAIFGFIPLFLFELYALGFIGTMVLKNTSRQAERKASVKSGTGGGHLPITSYRPSPDLKKQVTDKT
jgi:hypothetical protein